MKLKNRLGGGYKSYLLKESNNNFASLIVRSTSLGLFSFLLAFVTSSILSPSNNSSAATCENGIVLGGSSSDICGTGTSDVNVSIEGAWTVSISSSSTLGVDITPTSSGNISTAVDNVNIYTNTPNGYQLYLNSTTGSTDIYNNNDTQQERNHFTATSGTKSTPITLTSNTWGYSLATNPTTFSKVEATSTAGDSLITTGTKTSGEGDNLDVTYGFNADTKLTPGTYTTNVTYTAIAEVPNYTIQSANPSSLTLDQGAQDITIITTTPATELGLGDITVKVKNTTLGIDLALTNCTETTAEISSVSYRAATCTYPGGTIEQGGLPVGTYNIELTSSWHSATYVKTDAITVSSNYYITSVTPDAGNNNAVTTITMVTNAPTASSTAFGTVTGKIGSTNLTNCTATTSGNYRAVQCTIPSGVTAGIYTVSFAAAGHSFTTYSKASAVTIRAYLTVSGGTGSGWYAPNTKVNISASACNTGYTFNNWTATGGTIASATSSSTTITTTASNITVTRNCKLVPCSSIASDATGNIGGYSVKKLRDGKCWMTTNYKNSTWYNASCPSGFTLPDKSAFDYLIALYGNGNGIYNTPFGSSNPYWSSTQYDSSTAYALFVTPTWSAVSGGGGITKDQGYNIRCYSTN
ncbi:hypothetical protein IKG16_01150 [Candidatus Saccharibacteria bacterium]|nr:hypothetical protein [Candidatus Saccharibacteria bacterium]